MSDAAPSIVTTVDVPACPLCSSPATVLGRQERACNACGLTWRVVTEQDELDAQADRAVRSREWNEERGAARKIGRNAQRW
jgi:hypothetical protein